MKFNRSMFISALILAAMPVSIWAQTETASNAVPARDPAATAATPSPEAELRSELEQLKELVRDQQKRIAALEAGGKPATETTTETTVAIAPPSPAVNLEASNTATASSAPRPQNVQAQNVQAGSSDERIRNLERQIKGLGPISFSGDVRLRAEPFFGGPSDESLERVRGRFRTRFNAIADLGPQFQASITLASGDLNDPISTNQTITGFYTRKPIALDQAYVQFTPKDFKPLTLVGGKFRYPWYNTELTWDKDLNPEGAAQTLAFKLDTPVLKRFALVGFELPFAEVAGLSANDKRVTQQITYGGQLQTSWQLAPRVALNAYSGFYDYRGADAIALALARASTKNPQTPLSGLLPLNSSNPVQDSITTTTATTIITVNGTAFPTGVTSVSNAQFASKFKLFDNIARLDIDTGIPRLPVQFIGDYVQNMGACQNLANIVAAPANSATTTYKQTVNSPCFSKQRRGYWMEGRVGRLQEKGDFQLGYTHIYIEREAVVGNLNYSEMRQGSNVTQHRFDFFYQFDRNVQLGVTALVGRPLGSTEPWLTRMQFDTIYVF